MQSMRYIRTNTSTSRSHYLDVSINEYIEDGFLYNYTSDDDIKDSRFLNKEGVEAWWNDLVLLSSGNPDNHMIMFGIGTNPQMYTLDSLGPWKEPFLRFIQRGLSRKSGDKLISDTLDSIKLDSVGALPRSKFKQLQHPVLGNLVIALNQPARLTLGLAYNHCLGRVTGANNFETSVAILTEDGCIAYYLFDRYMGPASLRNSKIKAEIEEIQFKKRFNKPCREYTPAEMKLFEAVARDFGGLVSNEKVQLQPHVAFMLALKSDLNVLNNWRQQGIESDSSPTQMSLHLFVGGFGPFKIKVNRWLDDLNLELLYYHSMEFNRVGITFDANYRVESLFLPLSWMGEPQEQYLADYLTNRFGANPDFDVYAKYCFLL